MVKEMNVLILTKYGRLGASSRMRFFQYLPWLAQSDIEFTVKPLLSSEMLQARYQREGHNFWVLLRAYFSRWKVLRQRHQFDLIWIEKETLQWFPLWSELALLKGVPYVLDYDDAVFHNYDLHPSPWVRKIYGRRLDGLMNNAALVVAGNHYLAQRARDAGAAWVEVVPTVINLTRYPYQPKASVSDIPRIVWIGSPSTAPYLQLLREPLQALAKHHEFVLRIIGGGAVELPGVQVEVLPWSEDTEAESISACNIGVMPLLDSSWERGKCGYKLIQYMACGLPVVASKVGANVDIVREGANGFLADTPNEWFVALDKLLKDKSLQEQLGQVGRQCVEDTYCIQKTGVTITGLLQSAAEKD